MAPRRRRPITETVTQPSNESNQNEEAILPEIPHEDEPEDRVLYDTESEPTNTPVIGLADLVTAIQTLKTPRSPEGLKPVKLPVYKGGNLKTLDIWANGAENSFGLAPRQFASDENRIRWAVQSLEGPPAYNWSSAIQAGSVDIKNYTWDQFREFLANLIEDPGNRDLDIIEEYESAKQKLDQPVQRFAAYLQQLENLHPEEIDPHRSRNALLAKLKPELKAQLKRNGAIPETRETLLQTCIRIESGMKSETENNTPKTENNKKRGASGPLEEDPQNKRQKTENDRGRGGYHRGRGRFGGGNNTNNGRSQDRNQNQNDQKNAEQPKNDTDKSHITCRKCGHKGHYSNECYTKEENYKVNIAKARNQNQQGKDEPSGSNNPRDGRQTNQ
jgi:hypothetical protein